MGSPFPGVETQSRSIGAFLASIQKETFFGSVQSRIQSNSTKSWLRSDDIAPDTHPTIEVDSRSHPWVTAMNTCRSYSSFHSFHLALAAVVMGASMLGVPAHAATYQWINPNGGNWDDSNNWVPSGFPRLFFDFAVFNLEATYDVNATNAAMIPRLAGVQVSRGRVSLSTHDSLKTALVVGTSTNPATFVLHSGRIIASATYHNIGPVGTLILEPGSRLESRSTGNIGFAISAGGVLRGHEGSLENQVLRSFGTVSPGVAPQTPGMLLIGADTPAAYIQRETGVLEIEIGGLQPGTSHDQLRVVNGALGASLDGTLVVALIDNFVPGSSDRFDILVAPAITGTFASEVLPSLPGVEFSVVYEPTRVSVVATRSASAQVYALDIKPGSCPNSVNARKQGVIPAALLGSEKRQVAAVDPSSLRLEGVAPLRWSYEDVSAPFEAEAPCECSAAGPDGLEDMTLKFSAPELLEAIGSVSDGEERLLTLTGTLVNGDPLEATDCIVIRVVGHHEAPGRPVILARTQAPGPLQRVTYALPAAGEVRLSVFSVTGRKVADVVHAVQEAGEHTAEWNAGWIPTGLYFYHLKAGGSVASAKLKLLQ